VRRALLDRLGGGDLKEYEDQSVHSVLFVRPGSITTAGKGRSAAETAHKRAHNTEHSVQYDKSKQLPQEKRSKSLEIWQAIM